MMLDGFTTGVVGAAVDVLATAVVAAGAETGAGAKGFVGMEVLATVDVTGFVGMDVVATVDVMGAGGF
jgi:hypothetical protein